MKAQTGPDYPEMAREAVTAALRDAGLPYTAVEAVVAGYCYGEPTCGQRAVYEMGLTGVPVVNVNNNCSTGSTALFVARNFVAGGLYSCALALGFEKMERNLSQKYTDSGYTSPVARHFDYMFACGSNRQQVGRLNEMTGNVIKMFGDAALEHQRKYGSNDAHLTTLAYKNHKHSVNNPYAQLQKEIPFAFVKAHGLESQAVEIVAQALVTDVPSSFDLENKSFANLCGFDLTSRGAQQVFRDSGLKPSDVDVLEVHDCFSVNELLVMEAVGLCGKGEGGKLVDSGRWIRNAAGGELFQVGGRWVVNPSGGLESKGHPIGATGLAQCAELCWQLRGKADKRQVEGAKVALQHNFGLGSAAVVTLYRVYSAQPSEAAAKARL
ncbi:uncharacterized protein ACA1_275820 [Acanthamoeba castellanii str. Neff]|uniref:Uncharacterized protein n=1 Tax=Acanthamoeba castellanii (strain ATCC 30010 / Neff) TaxID=1257118 RepID=L8GS12_ACACF|nr:uncharacterized protein ACA1_275820 [Acanthamoeba castellanii str. Neff]ELR15408.1 hypothetical protein ACA1_275820 [Acanthamoeba castellanii str. Neff]